MQGFLFFRFVRVSCVFCFVFYTNRFYRPHTHCQTHKIHIIKRVFLPIIAISCIFLAVSIQPKHSNIYIHIYIYKFSGGSVFVIESSERHTLPIRLTFYFDKALLFAVFKYTTSSNGFGEQNHFIFLYRGANARAPSLTEIDLCVHLLSSTAKCPFDLATISEFPKQYTIEYEHQHKRLISASCAEF